MRSVYYILAVIGAVVDSQGTIDPIDSYSLRLASKISTNQDDVASLTTYAREKLEEHYQQSKDSFLEHVFDLIQQVKTSGHLSCSESLHDVLDGAPYKLFFSWKACWRLTEVLSEFEAFAKEIEDNLLDSETAVCDGIQAFGLCTGNWFSQIKCKSNVIQETVKNFGSTFKGVNYFLDEFRDIYNDTVTTANNCFSLWSSKSVELIQSAVEKHCE